MQTTTQDSSFANTNSSSRMHSVHPPQNRHYQTLLTHGQTAAAYKLCSHKFVVHHIHKLQQNKRNTKQQTAKV